MAQLTCPDLFSRYSPYVESVVNQVQERLYSIELLEASAPTDHHDSTQIPAITVVSHASAKYLNQLRERLSIIEVLSSPANRTSFEILVQIQFFKKLLEVVNQTDKKEFQVELARILQTLKQTQDEQNYQPNSNSQEISILRILNRSEQSRNSYVARVSMETKALLDELERIGKSLESATPDDKSYVRPSSVEKSFPLLEQQLLSATSELPITMDFLKLVEIEISHTDGDKLQNLLKVRTGLRDSLAQLESVEDKLIKGFFAAVLIKIRIYETSQSHKLTQVNYSAIKRVIRERIAQLERRIQSRRP